MARIGTNLHDGLARSLANHCENRIAIAHVNIKKLGKSRDENAGSDLDAYDTRMHQEAFTFRRLTPDPWRQTRDVRARNEE